MMMEDHLGMHDLNIRRYSVVGNDSQFKAYTRDYSFTIGSSGSGRH